MFTIGFIGTGTMASALVPAAAKSLDAGEIILSNRTAEKAAALAEKTGCASADKRTAAGMSRFITLGVKPHAMGEVLAEISDVLADRQDGFVIVSMAAGITTGRIRELAGGEYPVIRIMPNTPCFIGRGVILTCRTENVSDSDYDEFRRIMASAGVTVDIPESLMDAGCAVSGCGPAFVYTFIDAVASAGEKCGLPPETALALAGATVLGAADMAVKSDKPLAELRDNVCSPGGATIEGVKVLENGDFRAVVNECVAAAYKRSMELGK